MGDAEAETDTYGFKAFGEINTSTGNTPNPHTFVGKFGYYEDADTDFYFLNARYYDASVGAFISQDPIGFAAGDTNLSRYVGDGSTNLTDSSGFAASGTNLYRYVRNSPMRFTDPSGLQQQPVRDSFDAEKAKELGRLIATTTGYAVGTISGFGIDLMIGNAQNATVAAYGAEYGVAIGDKVGDVLWPCLACDDDWITLPVTIVNVAHAAKPDGGRVHMDAAIKILREVRIAKWLYGQCCIDLKVRILDYNRQKAAKLLATGRIDVRAQPSELPKSLGRLALSVQPDLNTRAYVFYVHETSEGLLHGRTYRSDVFWVPEDFLAPFANVIVVATHKRFDNIALVPRKAQRVALAHELGHVVGQRGHAVITGSRVPLPEDNFMTRAKGDLKHQCRLFRNVILAQGTFGFKDLPAIPAPKIQLFDVGE